MSKETWRKERRAMLEHHFWENFRKWVPHQDVDEVYDIEEIGFEEHARRALQSAKQCLE